MTVTAGSRVSLVTPSGTPYTRLGLDVSGHAALLLEPVSPPVALVLYMHGAGDNERHLVGDTISPLAYGAIERGWAVATINNNPSTGAGFGNPKAIELHRELREWIAAPSIRGTLLYGFSMGGMTAYNLSGRGTIPDLFGVAVVNGTVDSLESPSLSSIRSLFGAADNTDLLTKQQGYDPARDDPQRWADLPLFMSYSTEDAAVPWETHGKVFYDRATTPSAITHHVGTHQHVGGFMFPEVFAWAEPLVPQPATPPLPPGVLYRTDGSPVALYRTDGTAVPVG